MGYRELGTDLSYILNLIDNLPGLRNDPADPTGTVKLFDGGRLINITGATRYEFEDGTTASLSTAAGAPLFITFPSGWKVSIELARKFCINCGRPLRRAAKFCPACGERTA